MKPRAITGYSVLSALGVGRETFERALRDPEAVATSAITTFDPSPYFAQGVPHVAEVPDFDPTQFLGDKGLRTLDRLTKLMVVSARLALGDAGLKKTGNDGAWGFAEGVDPTRVGVVCSNAYGSLEAITELDRVAKLEDARYINPAKFPNTVSNSASGYVSIWEDLRALNITVSDGNPGGLDGFAVADLMLATRRADAILVGGAEAMCEALFLAFAKLEAGPDHAKLAEAAVFLAVEPTAAAAARGATIFGHIYGYGTAFEAPTSDVALFHASAPAVARALRSALADAGIEASAVGRVVSGIAGLPRFDEAEHQGITDVFGPSIAIERPKARFGETLGASGTLAVATALAGPTAATTFTVVVSVGYYGNVSAVVVRSA
jgi:3-oxoacyl-(acyl-carrier-protein) synthase